MLVRIDASTREKSSGQRSMPTDASADEQFSRSVLALALGRRVTVIAVPLVFLWLAIFWAEALP